jgi:hypothetical protein
MTANQKAEGSRKEILLDVCDRNGTSSDPTACLFDDDNDDDNNNMFS